MTSQLLTDELWNEIGCFFPSYEDSSLGTTRWRIERTVSWLKQFRRQRIRWDRLDQVHQAFHDLANSLITWRYLAAE